MKKEALNPYLPLGTYIPDGEPHVFGDQVYVYGSHDEEGGDNYCMLDYECWSAPINDLGNWRCEGTIYRAEQCRHYCKERQDMYAPDVVQGNDGRFYLYYDLSGRGNHGFDGPISVAVCDTPAGKYEYYGDVSYSDGRPLQRFIPFDPAVMNDNGRIWLTYGWGLGMDTHALHLKAVMPMVMSKVFHKTVREIQAEEPQSILGANIVELEKDMLTVKEEPKRILPALNNAPVGSELRKHSFYEAASLRKFGELYYFIYSSHKGHELCYATSKYPDRDYEYRGVIVSNGDIGYHGRKPKDRLALTGTNHGSIEKINGEYYIFYHRCTHKTGFSRQGCAERIEIQPDGMIQQVEMTSCGLNSGPLKAEGVYPAAIACNLTNGKMPHLKITNIKKSLPNINHDESDRFVTEISDGTSLGFKYFEFMGKEAMSVITRGSGTGEVLVSKELDSSTVAKIPILASPNWTRSQTVTLVGMQGVSGLFLKYKGSGNVEMLQIEIKK